MQLPHLGVGLTSLLNQHHDILNHLSGIDWVEVVVGHVADLLRHLPAARCDESLHQQRQPRV